jgi:hypothetical protein
MAVYTKPDLRERLKAELKRSDQGGRKGQWSARKSQLLAQRYKAAGGGYRGKKDDRQRGLDRWTREAWQTADGSARARRGTSTKRYLPKAAWEKLPPKERARTDRKKRRAKTQFVPNTPAARRARKAASGETKAELLRRARSQGVRGRSRMTKAELQRALRR